MNIGIRLHDLDGQGLEAKLKNAQELGFTCVHLAISKVEPGFSMAEAPALLTEAYAATVRGLLERYGLQAAVLGCYLNLATPDPAELAQTTACYLAHLRFAAWIGAKMVGTETGAPNREYAATEECFTPESLALFIQRLRPVVAAAEQWGVPLAIEPVSRHIVHTPARAKEVLDALASPFCKIILDPVNLLSASNVSSQEELFAQALTLLGGSIEAVHWKDYRMAEGEVCAVAGGMGELRGESVLRYLAARPQLPVTLEDANPRNAAKVRAGLAEQLCRLGMLQ